MSLYSNKDSGFAAAFLIAGGIMLFILIGNYLEAQTKLAKNSSKPQTNYVVFVTNYVDAPTNNR